MTWCSIIFINAICAPQDYYDIIRRPMDLGKIGNKLRAGVYTEPWEYVEDVNLVFANAWLYNKPTDLLYKSCSRVQCVLDSVVANTL